MQVTQTIKQTTACCGKAIICDCAQIIYGSSAPVELVPLQLPVRREDKRDRYNQRTFAPPGVRRKRR